MYFRIWALIARDLRASEAKRSLHAESKSYVQSISGISETMQLQARIEDSVTNRDPEP